MGKVILNCFLIDVVFIIFMLILYYIKHKKGQDSESVAALPIIGLLSPFSTIGIIIIFEKLYFKTEDSSIIFGLLLQLPVIICLFFAIKGRLYDIKKEETDVIQNKYKNWN